MIRRVYPLAEILNTQGTKVFFFAPCDQPGNFYTVVEAARQRGEIAVGYRVGAKAKDADQSYGVVINPPKPAEITFTEQDRIIVLANY